jgi:hypothetical protein
MSIIDTQRNAVVATPKSLGSTFRWLRGISAAKCRGSPLPHAAYAEATVMHSCWE